MYEKKMRQLLSTSREKAEQALDQDRERVAASYYEQCGDILMEQAQNERGRHKKRVEEQAQQFYDLSAELRGEQPATRDGTGQSGTNSAAPDATDTDTNIDTDMDAYVERFVQDSDVTWDDVAGLSTTRQQVKESFALAAIEQKPDAVEGLHSVLLYGPPGTGKSLLAAAVAGSHDFTFLNVKLSQALSKYYGESGKIISELFGAARERAPSVVFFDEIDAATMSRSGDVDESTRRVLSTLLTELSGLGAENEEVLFLSATNAPWDIDQAILSRMERMIYVPLPDEQTAAEIIRLNTVEEGVELADAPEMYAETCVEQLYSGREIKHLCREAIRHMVNAENPDLDALSERPFQEIREYELQVRPLTQDDFDHAFAAITPNTSEEDLKRYKNWSAT